MSERVTGDATPPLSPEERHYLLDVLEGLQPMGGHTLYDEEGRAAGSVCGARNVPPYVPSIRRALQAAAEAEIDPESLYRRAVEMYERLDAERRREHPEWGTWPAPPFEAVEPVTWPPLKLEVQYSMHASRVISALWAREDDPQRVERLRRILRRAQGRGLDPATVYRKATEVYVAGGVDRRPPSALRAGHARPRRAAVVNVATPGRPRTASPGTSAPDSVHPVRVVLFDLGGVLVEFTGPATLLRWLGDRLTPEQIWPMWLGSSVVQEFEAGRVGPDVFADRLIADLGLPVDRGQFLADFAGWPKALFAGAADLVGRIPPSYLRATLSNTNVLHWPRLTRDLGLGALFDHHFPSHMIGKLKPDREVFAHVAQTLLCEPSAILFLDDQPLNVQAALAVGIRAVRVSGVQEAESTLTEMGVLPAQR